MIYFSDFSLPSGPTTDVVFAVQDFDTGTTTGSASYTSSTITGVTPKGALLIGALHDASNDPGETASLCRSIGITEGTNQRRSVFASRDNNASTGVFGGYASAAGLTIYNASLSAIKVADIDTVSGGISVNYGTNSSPSLRHFFIAFAGADVSAFAGTRNLGTGTSAQDLTDSGFQPDAVIFIGAGLSSTSAGSTLRSVFGIAVNNAGVVTQRCVLAGETQSAADGAPFMTLRDDCCAGDISQTDGTLTYKVTASDFDASGFSLTCNASAGSDLLGFLSLKFTGRQVKLVDFTTPTSTGSFTISGAGFTPRFALLVVTNLEAVNDHPGATSDNQGGLAICAIGDETWSASWRTDSGAATSDTASQVSNVAIMGASATDCDAIKGTFTAWTSDGVQLSMSAVQGTGKKGFALFVE